MKCCSWYLQETVKTFASASSSSDKYTVYMDALHFTAIIERLEMANAQISDMEEDLYKFGKQHQVGSTAMILHWHYAALHRFIGGVHCQSAYQPHGDWLYEYSIVQGAALLMLCLRSISLAWLAWPV